MWVVLCSYKGVVGFGIKPIVPTMSPTSISDRILKYKKQKTKCHLVYDHLTKYCNPHSLEINRPAPTPEQNKVSSLLNQTYLFIFGISLQTCQFGSWLWSLRLERKLAVKTGDRDPRPGPPFPLKHTLSTWHKSLFNLHQTPHHKSVNGRGI